MNCSKYLWPMVFASVMAGFDSPPLRPRSCRGCTRESSDKPLSSVGRSKTPLVRVIFNGGQYSQSRSQHENTDEFEQLC